MSADEEAQGSRWRRLRSVDRSLFVIFAAIVVVAGILAIAVLRDNTATVEAGAASPSASPDEMTMGLAHIPTSNACVLCHVSGGEAGLKPVPAIGHPLDGWGACTVCHTDEKLGRTAPGHAGIQQSECTKCHKVAPEGPAITQAHSNLEEPCLDCHGKVAHLPSSMVGRNQTECWLCHKPRAEDPPQFPHRYDPETTCRSCHRSQDVGGLPIDHALRSDDSCVLCHDLQLFRPSPSPDASPSTVPEG